MKKVTVIIEKCVQIGPVHFRMKRCSRNYEVCSPISDMLAWAESLGIEDATINDLTLCDYDEQRLSVKERWASMTAEERCQYWWRVDPLGGVWPIEWGLAWENLSPLTRACLKNVIHHGG